MEMMKILSGLVLIILTSTLQAQENDVLIAVPTEVTAEEQVEKPDLKILSWNIYMLPRFVKSTGKIKRAYAIVEELKKEEYDIIVFQEAFHKRARTILSNGLEEIYPYQLGPFNTFRLPGKTHSGIWIISKVPLEELGTVAFSRCEGFDCWSRKGALLAEGNWFGETFQILGTHLQSGGSAIAEKIRQVQMAEIKEFLLQPFKKTDVTQILCGDFNVTKDVEAEGKYARMLEMLNVPEVEFIGNIEFSYDGAMNLLADGGEKNRKTLDYIFMKGNGKLPAFFKKSIRVFTNPWNHKIKDLSDHYAIEAIIKF